MQRLLPPVRERLFQLAKRRVGEGRAEEIVQETLATVWEKRADVRDADHFLPFLFQVLRHKVGGAYLRSRRSRIQRASAEDIENVPADPPSGNPESLMEAEEMRGILAEAIEACAGQNRTWGRVLQLLGEGRSPMEIRDELGQIPMATVHTRIHRARKRLKEILREQHQIEL